MWQIFKQLRDMKMPIVVDADGLYITTKNLDLVRGNPNCIMTPNKNEFQRLAAQLNVDIEVCLSQRLLSPLLTWRSSKLTCK